MRAVIQPVASAFVTVNNEVISQISRGLMVLVGTGAGLHFTHSAMCVPIHAFKTDDNASDVELLSKKISVLHDCRATCVDLTKCS